MPAGPVLAARGPGSAWATSAVPRRDDRAGRLLAFPVAGGGCRPGPPPGPHGVAGWGLDRGARLEVVTRQDVAAATMAVVRAPGELFLLRHTFGADTVAWVERIDPVSPGGLAAHADGGLLVVYGRWAHDPGPTTPVGGGGGP